MDRLYTVGEAAAALNISTAFLYKLTSNKGIGHFKVGAKLRFSDAHLNEYLAAREVAARERPS